LKYEAERVLNGTDLTTKVTRLVQALRKYGGVANLPALQKVWQDNDPDFLRNELSVWCKSKFVSWPPLSH